LRARVSGQVEAGGLCAACAQARMHLSAENVHEIVQQVVDDGIGGQCSVLVLVAPTVGALAAARILLVRGAHVLPQP
jgi:hypothetical protein